METHIIKPHTIHHINTPETLFHTCNKFGLDLIYNLESASNIISPISICLSLSLIHLVTYEISEIQLSNLLMCQYDINDLEYVQSLLNNDTTKIVTTIISKNGVKSDYKKLVGGLALFYKIKKEPELVSQKINDLMEQSTDGMVKSIISPKDIKKGLSLVSTVYFKGSWQHKFDPKNTTKMIFHESKMVDVMHQINYFNFFENEHVQMVELPYDGEDFAMNIILPRQHLEQIEVDYSINNVPHFNLSEINEFINNASLMLVDLYLPKFVQKKRWELVDIFRKMGLESIFDRDYAGLGSIAKHAFVGNVVHEACILVDELGMEGMKDVANVKISDGKSPIVFKATYAFVYFVRHISFGMILLYGDYQGN